MARKFGLHWLGVPGLWTYGYFFICPGGTPKNKPFLRHMSPWLVSQDSCGHMPQLFWGGIIKHQLMCDWNFLDTYLHLPNSCIHTPGPIPIICYHLMCTLLATAHTSLNQIASNFCGNRKSFMKKINVCDELWEMSAMFNSNIAPLT